VVCFDEASKQLVEEKRSSLPAAAGKVTRFDYEYERKGTSNLFMLCQPLRGWRWLQPAGGRRSPERCPSGP
jgi:hypothetical protein